MFTGHGYNAEFTVHMDRKIKMLSDDTEIFVEEGCDEICEKCPNREQDVCRERDKVRMLDEKVLEACGVSYGDRIPWKDITETVRGQVLNTERFESICRDCEWYSLCREISQRI